MDDDSYFMIGDVAKATGETVGTIRQWLQRGILVASDSIWPAGQKTPRLFSVRTAFEIAVTRALTRHGLPAGAAAEAALSFAHSGGEDTATGAPATDDVNLVRRPGALFPDGMTFLIVPDDPQKTRVVKITGRLPSAEFLTGEPRTIICLNPIIEHVSATLSGYARKSSHKEAE